MGIESATIALGAMSVASEVGQASKEQQAAQAEQERLELQAQQEKLKHNQQMIKNYDNLQKMIGKQEAAASARGYKLSSPSFNAMQLHSMQIASKHQQNMNTRHAINMANIDMERHNVQNKLSSQLFGNAISIGKDWAELAGGMPSFGGTEDIGG